MFPGIQIIRERLGFTREALASVAKISPSSVFKYESGSGSTAGNLQALAAAMCCKLDDLTATPTEARLAEIRAAYLQAQADAARAHADQLAAAESRAS